MDTRVTGIVFDIQHFSVHDGPGIRTNVFLKGCPIRCRWCCNPESQRFEPQMTFECKLCIGCGECARRCPHNAVTAGEGKAIVDLHKCADCTDHPCVGGCYARALKIAGKEMTVDEVLAEVLRDSGFYRDRGGVTFTGGEPFSQPAFLAALVSAAKQAGLTTAVETCLCVPWGNIEPSLAHIDTFLCDIKHVDAEKLRAFTGAEWERIRDNLSRLVENGKTVVARVPVIGGFNATQEEISAIASFAVRMGIREMHLLPYHGLGKPKYDKLERAYPMPDTSPPGRELMAELGAAAQQSGITIQYNG